MNNKEYDDNIYPADDEEEEKKQGQVSYPPHPDDMDPEQEMKVNNKHLAIGAKKKSPGGPVGDSPGGLDLNFAELYHLIPVPDQNELLCLKFKRKPLGFDREVCEKYQLNCRVKTIHKQKLQKAGLRDGMYIRKINDRFVGRLKFVAIEALLRNTACPMTIVFRKKEPPLNADMLAKLERRGKAKIRDQGDENPNPRPKGH